MTIRPIVPDRDSPLLLTPPTEVEWRPGEKVRVATQRQAAVVDVAGQRCPRVLDTADEARIVPFRDDYDGPLPIQRTRLSEMPMETWFKSNHPRRAVP